MDKYLGIEFDKYGFSLDSAYVYVSLSWGALAVLLVSVVGYRIIKSRKAR